MKIIETNLKMNGSLTYGNNPNKIILHHAEASNCCIEDINSWHLGNGWTMCGYHYFVRKDGSIYRGRPESVIGAHCPGQNSCSIGICAEGSYMIETMPQAQLNAIVELISDIKNRYGMIEIGGHKEYYSTNCPGENYPLDRIKNGEVIKNKGYVVTNYLPNAWEGYEAIDLEYALKYFQGVKCYMKHNEKGMWIETEYIPYKQCLDLKEKLGSWFYSIE